MATTLDQQAQLSENWAKALQEGITNKRQFRKQEGNLSNVPLQDTVGFRGAGWQDAPTQQGIKGDSELFNALSGKFGYYKQGDQENYGYYGNDNPYDQATQERLLGEKGYTKDTTGLNALYQKSGYRLPELNGNVYANAQQRAQGNDLRNYYNQQNTQSNGSGFIPGQDNGDWKWQAGVPQWARMQGNNWMAELSKGLGGNLEGTPEEQWGKDADAYFAAKYPEGSGSWQYTKNGKPVDAPVMEYTPEGGVQMQKQDKLAGSPGSWMPALTMAVLGGMTGTAAPMMAGVSAGTAAGGALAGLGAAVPSAMATGLNTGDWGKALAGMGTGALTGGLTPSLSGVFGGGQLGQGVARAITGAAGGGLQALVSGDNPMKGIATGAISGGLGSALSSLGTNLNMDKMSSNALANTITSLAKKKLQRKI